MTTLHQTVTLPGEAPALLVLPPSMTVEALTRLEQAVASALGTLRQQHSVSAADAGALEYASWRASIAGGGSGTQAV